MRTSLPLEDDEIHRVSKSWNITLLSYQPPGVPKEHSHCFWLWTSQCCLTSWRSPGHCGGFPLQMERGEGKSKFYFKHDHETFLEKCVTALQQAKEAY